MVTKGEIYYADLEPVIGSEQGGVRPVVILQNDKGNEFSPTTIVAPITTKEKSHVPMHVELFDVFLSPNSMVLLEQIRAIDKTRLIKKYGKLSEKSIEKVMEALIMNFVYEDDKYG